MSDPRYLDGTVQQSSHDWDPADYRDLDISYPVLGLVLAVYAPDHPQNNSSLKNADQRGSYWEADVLILNNGLVGDDIIPHVVIAPNGPTGAWDYCQDIPTPCSQMLDGSEYRGTLSNIDVDKLDGDRCVVQFIGGKYNQPYMSSWYPHPANVTDPSTGGFASRAIDQGTPLRRRYKGVDVTVTPEGNVYIDTNNSGSVIVGQPGGYVREQRDPGGHIQLDVKNTKKVEINFNAPAPDSNLEPSLPQPNPSPAGSFSALRAEDDTKFYMDKDFIQAVAGQVVELLSQASGAFIKVDENGNVEADGPGIVKLGNPPTEVALTDGAVHASGVDTFTGATYGALGNASAKVIIEK